MIGFAYIAFRGGYVLEAVLCGIGTTLIGGALLFFIGGFIGLALPVVEVVETQELCATQEGYYLLSDTVTEQAVDLQYYSVDGENVKSIGRGRTHITESNDKAEIQTRTVKFEKDWWGWFAHTELYPNGRVDVFIPANTVADIVIPEETIEW